ARNFGASVVCDAPPPRALLRPMRSTPLVAWLARRSRKLLPRLVAAWPAEMSELMMVMPGVGVGWGDGNIWASADDTAPIARAKATAMARSTLRRAPVSPACDGRNPQRMNSNPTGRPARTGPDSLPLLRRDLPPVRR